ncbi:MAG: type II toxin-antitoxin system HicB family antitoxin [Proteobacteria bacterium]|nr:type II toxin-antitoxin system HicB family antitoxin [Pseudomonadota bacterium]
MSYELTMIYWKSEKFWLGKLKEYPEIMTQGESLEELEENLRDAYHEMVLEDIPDNYKSKLIAV